MQQKKPARDYSKVIGSLSLISGIVFGLLSFFGIFGLIILYLSNKSLKPGIIELLISLAFSAITFISGLYGYKKFEQLKDIKFYNSALLIGLSIFNLIVTIIGYVQSFENFMLLPSTIILNALLSIINCIALIMQGTYLLNIQKEKIKMKKETNQENKGRLFSIIGLVCAIVSLLFIPVLFGPAAIILGIVARKKGDEAFGLIVIILGAVFLVLGMILGVALQLLLNWDKISTAVQAAK